MERNNVLAAVREICSGALDNNAIDKLLDAFEAALPHSDICDLLFQDFRNLTPEQVVEEACRREAAYVASKIGDQ